MTLTKHLSVRAQRNWIALAVLWAGILSAQNVPTFRTGVFLVHVDAEVLEQNNSPLTGLRKEDFRILDGGQEQTIVSFSEGEQPLDVILLFDISSSMRRQVKHVANVAHQGLHELRPGDCVSVMVFNTEAWTVAPFSTDPGQVEEAIHRVLRLDFRGGTRIQDAVYDAARVLIAAGNPYRRRRAVLVITDNLGIPHRKSSAIESLWEADALLAGLVVPNRTAIKGLLAPLGATRPGGIEDLVAATGGDMIRSQALETDFPDMMHRIRSRYTLYYRLPEGDVGSLRTIDVQLSARGRERVPGAHILARRGYRLQERDHYGFATRQ